MNIIFLDFDGVMNSNQSVEHFHWAYQQGQKGTRLPEDIESLIINFDRKRMWLCDIALSNLAHVLDLHPTTRIVVSSTWRQGRQVQWFNELFEYYKLLRDKNCSWCDGEGGTYKNSSLKEFNECRRCSGKGYTVHPCPKNLVIDKTPVFHGKERGDEIKWWLENNKHLPIDKFVILDDDSDMGEFRDTHHFIQTDNRVGLDWLIVEKIDKVFGGFTLTFEDLKPGIGYKVYSKPRDTTYYIDSTGDVYYYDQENQKHSGVHLYKRNDRFALA